MLRIKSRLERFLVRLFYGQTVKYHGLDRSESMKPESYSEKQTIVSFQRLALVTVALPLFGFAFCVFWSLCFDFFESTSTHCGVSNYLPSVSASIGSFSPQKHVWRLTIALHSTPRYLVAFVYFKLIHYSKLLFVLNVVEISALLGLSIVSSTDNFVIHANCFLLFISSTFCGTMIHLLDERLWSKFKLKSYIINTLAWILALFFYIRHNQYCETGVYTMFAAAEYIFVLSNMIFHFQAYYDFAELYFVTSYKDKPLENDHFKFIA
ncbi:hypothetical protein RDWZM_006876 [Blomia tropicalis]|uniref:CWH43-like N-terminal domain-containing protein n=1 Tax=Blomia tropicalis TaxID=40697 RepID=A0A9Q0RNS2_BLOTA|nr:Post-GPI attachment to proteins factor 2 [Blomia tropicalis]KAJ6221064.1 hypothetical protein RDWZM_006876 [Blomia tropicalis]